MKNIKHIDELFVSNEELALLKKYVHSYDQVLILSYSNFSYRAPSINLNLNDEKTLLQIKKCAEKFIKLHQLASKEELELECIKKENDLLEYALYCSTCGQN